MLETKPARGPVGEYANLDIGMCARYIEPHPHKCTLASIHKSEALSSHELIATFEYVYSYKGSGH